LPVFVGADDSYGFVPLPIGVTAFREESAPVAGGGAIGASPLDPLAAPLAALPEFAAAGGGAAGYRGFPDVT
jgi:hypothetical protein